MLDSLITLPESVLSRSVLLVDDSLFQLELISALLRSMGLRDVRQATDGAVALQLLGDWQGALPVLILDLEMPGMDGISLLQRLAEKQIRLQVIIASGREAGLIRTVECMLLACGLPFLGSLAKPVSALALHQLLLSAGAPPRPVPPQRPPQLPSEAELVEAIRTRQIQPYYQPKIALQSGRIVGYEVLARWLGASGQGIAPVEFIPLAKRGGWLSELTFCVLQQALQDRRALDGLSQGLQLAINLDIHQLADRCFADQLIDCVRRAGSSPSQWILEVTESSLMQDPAVTLGTIGRLGLAGFGLSIDDYGTGFSTLQQLSRLPFTELKIDRAFIAEAHRNPRAHCILQAAIETGRSLKLPCIAEGIEHPQEALMLAQLGCFAGQGYLFARPMSGASLLDWHAAHRGRNALAQWLSA